MDGTTSFLERSTHDDGTPPRGPAGSGNGSGGRRPRPGDASLAVLGMWLALVPVFVLFLTLCTAYVLRQGTQGSGLWAPLPRLVWFNTAVLLASSALLEGGRTAQRRRRPPSRCFSAAFTLGALFLVAQLVTWLVWWKSGMGPDASPHSAFFYILTGTHGVHVLGGLLLLGRMAFRAEKPLLGLQPELVARVAAIYWHFLTALWVGLLALLQLWR